MQLPPAAPQGPPFVAKSRSLPRAPHLRPWPETETIWGRSGQNPWKVCKTNLTNEKNQGKTAKLPWKVLQRSSKGSLLVETCGNYECVCTHMPKRLLDVILLMVQSSPRCAKWQILIEKLWLAQGTVANKQFSSIFCMKVFVTNHMLEIGKNSPIDGKHRRACVANSASGTMRLN